MQIEVAIDNKKHIIRELNEKITEGIKEEMQLREAQQVALYQQKAAKRHGGNADTLAHKTMFEEAVVRVYSSGHVSSLGTIEVSLKGISIS